MPGEVPIVEQAILEPSMGRRAGAENAARAFRSMAKHRMHIGMEDSAGSATKTVAIVSGPTPPLQATAVCEKNARRTIMNKAGTPAPPISMLTCVGRRGVQALAKKTPEMVSAPSSSKRQH